MSTLSLSRGAVQVLDTAPAPPPATRCLHHIPVCLSSTVNSSGTVRFSPTSKICEERWHKPDSGPSGQDCWHLSPSTLQHGSRPGTTGQEKASDPGWEVDWGLPLHSEGSRVLTPAGGLERTSAEHSRKVPGTKPFTRPLQSFQGAP